MVADERFDAGFNLDGTFFALSHRELDRPFMMVGRGDDHGSPGQDDTWDRVWEQLDGWKRWISVKGTTHSAMTDFSPLGRTGRPERGRSRRLPQQRDLPGPHHRFVDAHLRGEDEPILEGPNETWPELVFHNP